MMDNSSLTVGKDGYGYIISNLNPLPASHRHPENNNVESLQRVSTK